MCRKITKKELNTILRNHKKWLDKKPGGVKADLSFVNLSGVNLQEVDLSYANLEGSDLFCTNLCSADLYGANLSSASLFCANLCYANLQGAILVNADLEGANLFNAVFDVTDSLIDFRKGKILTKPLIGYKKCRNNVIVTLEIPKGAIVYSINGKKCRTNKVKVLTIEGADEGISWFNGMSYCTGDTITISNFNCEYNKECARGIHFFVNKEDAEKY